MPEYYEDYSKKRIGHAVASSKAALAAIQQRTKFREKQLKAIRTKTSIVRTVKPQGQKTTRIPKSPGSTRTSPARIQRGISGLYGGL